MQLSFLLQRCPPALQQQPTAPVNSCIHYLPSLRGALRFMRGKLAPFISILCIPPLPGEAPAAHLAKARAAALSLPQIKAP
ncbi:hypothetical protein PBY51_016955 [Eleginops maclovinus]|uniref:Uncharacterized protein n=1 Tax=Eleginops maclovinus TaxID=56733 RepID=A0AAN7WRV6_ELEMC|nr:hypothetical protein PBY51_016955 [Eleginops maclovinus]